MRNLLYPLIVLSVFLPLTVQAATVSNRICGLLNTKFTDSGIGEDIFDSPSNTYRPATYASASVYTSAGHSFWTGTLDSNGCTPDLYLNSGTSYKFRLRTRIQHPTDSTIKIYVADKEKFPTDACSTSSEQGAYKYYDQIFTATTSGAVTNLYFYNAGRTWFTNLTVLAGQLMKRHLEIGLGLAPNTYIFLHGGELVTYPGWCGKAPDSNINYFGVEINDTTADRSEVKFKTMHEIGHAIGDSGAGYYSGTGWVEGLANFGTGSYSATPQCNCDAVGGDSHCLQSRERIAAAQSEGFAHFIAAAVFNNRNTTNQSGVFGYYKSIDSDDAIYPDCNAGPDSPCPILLSEYVQWHNNYCPMVDRGVEWDWLLFFWNLWTNSDSRSRFSVNDILAVWEELIENDSTYTGDWLWNEVVDAANIAVGGMKRSALESIGDLSGVD